MFVGIRTGEGYSIRGECTEVDISLLPRRIPLYENLFRGIGQP